MPGRWHVDMQNLFAGGQQEVEFSFVDVSQKRRRVADVCVDGTVVEIQHSRITRREVNGRNKDYGEKLGKTVAWVIDCTENASSPCKISSEDEEEIWMLEFEKTWHVESMRDCNIIFAVFRDANGGERIFRVPIESVRYRLVLVFGSWTDMTEWRSHVTSGEINIDVQSPKQSTLTVAQDPHGSGKTYRLTRMMIHTDLPEYARYDAYSTFIIVTKSHSAKEVVYAEFMTHLRKTGVEYNVQIKSNKYIVKFTRPNNNAETMCIFGTADSLMFNLCDNKMCGTDVFINLIRTIHKHGPTKLRGPTGRFCYAGQQPGLNKKTLVVTDEATMLPEEYADAFATLMASCHVDVHLAGDVQQSSTFEHNLLTRVVCEYNDAADTCELPSFKGVHVIMNPGNEVRRFNQALVDFRNTVMGGFHAEPSHNLRIMIPIAASDVTHSRGEYSLHRIERTGSWDDSQSEQVVSTVETIMTQLKRDVYDSKLLPNEILIVTPFVKINPLMDELQTSIHEFWSRAFYDAEYECLLHEKSSAETDDAVAARVARYEDVKAHFERNSSSLPWFCVLHRGEVGKPIDTSESEYATRIVSIHASQGDGRKFAYVVGLAEKKLTRFSNGRIDLKYESLLNVAVSRMKEVIRVFLEPTYDDIWVRFLPLMPDEMRQTVPPTLNAKTKFKLLGACNIELDEALFNLTKDKMVAASPDDASVRHDRPVLDYAHHVIRMAIAHTVFWSHLVVHQANDRDFREQVLTIFNKVANAPIKSFPSTSYYEKLREESTIPVLCYDSGSAVFEPLLARTLYILHEVREHIRCWVRGKQTDLGQLTPEHAVLLQYAVEVFTLAPRSMENIKMDHVYDVVHCYMNKTDVTDSKLERHYDYLTQLTSMFHQVKDHAGEEPWQWKIHRSISLGTQRTGNPTQYFQFNTQIAHLFVTETRAMPIILCPSVDEMNMAAMCAKALLYTLVCIQPQKTVYKGNDKGIPTWQYVRDKRIEICLVPIKGSRPIFIDVMDIVEENIAVLSTWICEFTKNETEADIPQAQKIAEHYRDNFEEARELVCAAHNCGKCPDYMRDVFNEADDADQVSTLMKTKLTTHLKVLCRDIQRR